MLVSALSVLGLVAALTALAGPASAYNKNTDPVIFVHGYTENGYNGNGGCNTDSNRDVQQYFNNPQHTSPPQADTLEKTIRSYGWNGAFHYVGYYRCDDNLTSTSLGYDWLNKYNQYGWNWETPGWQAAEDQSDNSHCWFHMASGYHADEDCSINNLAYHLAWYIYWNFSRYGTSVHVVAHSMGGLIIRSALYERPRQSVFPPSLLVESVVAFATPNDGLNLPAFTTEQTRQMQGSSAYLASLNSNSDPQGNNGTHWLLIGSTGDLAVSPESATHMSGTGVYKVVYHYGPGHTNYVDDDWVKRINPNRTACWSLGSSGVPKQGTNNADNIGPMIERGLSSVWQSPPAANVGC